MPNPIQPVKVINASDLEENGGVYLVKKGMAARPVYGFTAQGNRAAKGVAYPVYVVSDAEFAAGDFVKGRGQPLPVGDIDDLGYVGALEGRTAIPVYAVNDWPTSPTPPPSFVGAYDDIPNLVHVYEPARRTLTSYTGNLIRIRRSSDNTEMDFGYIANGDLDVSAISAFIGGGTGHVVTVYDQVGGNNLTQATAASQPGYVASGQNGKPVMRSTTSQSLTTTYSAALSQPFNIYATIRLTGVNPTAIYVAIGGNSGLNSATLFRGSGGNWAINAGANLADGASTNTWRVFSLLYNGGSSAIFRDGVSQATGNAGTNNPTGITLFARSTGLDSFTGDIASVIVVDPSHTTPQREAMQTAINSYWGVY